MRVLLLETVTGYPVVDLEVISWSNDRGILAADKFDVEVPYYTPRSHTMDLRSLLVRDKHSIALIDEDVEGDPIVEAAGPIATVTAKESEGGAVYAVDCQGIQRLLDLRHVRTHPGWPLLTPENLPTGSYDQSFQNLEYGTIMKKVVQESEKFLGGGLPINYEDDRAGTHDRTSYAAIDGKTVLEVLDQLAELADGVEYDFQPVINSMDQVSYNFVTGTDASPIITGSVARLWNLGGVNPDIKGYEREMDPTPIITDSVFAGGKDEDSVLLARGQYHDPILEGWPRAEVWDRSHSSVSVQTTLQSWADSALGSVPDNISFKVKASAARGMRHGHIVRVASEGHWDMPDGLHEYRILSMSRNSGDPDWIDIKLV